MERGIRAKTLSAIAGMLTILLASQSPALAAQPAAAAPVIRVAALDNPPYAWAGPHGFQGLSVFAMKTIAAQNNWKVDFILEPDEDALTNAIITHQADIGIGGITPTPELSLIVDFSDADQFVPLALLVKKEGPAARLRHDLERTGSIFLNWQMLMLFAAALIAVLIAGYVIRMIERGRQGDMFPQEFRHNAWWAAQTIVAHNCGNKLPLSERGRYIAIVLMLGGTVFTAQITALLTTNLAASLAAGAPITGIGDVGKRQIATVNDSYAEQWTQQNLMSTRGYKTAEDCAAAVERGDVAGAVFDQMAFRKILTQDHYSDLELVGATFGSHPHAFMLTKNSPYTAAVNQGLASLLESGRMGALYAQWLNGTLQIEPQVQ